MEHHAVVAWDAIQRHVFMNDTDAASRCQTLEILSNLDHEGLLAKVVSSLRDVPRPLQQQDDEGHTSMQSPSSQKIDGVIPVSPMDIQRHGFSTPQHCRHQLKKGTSQEQYSA